MTRAWKTLDTAPGAAGRLELRQRGERDFLIAHDGRVLMQSLAHRSESALAEAGCRGLSSRAEPRVLVSGLGMGYTLRAALDRLPQSARVVVAEIEPAVVRWCRGPLAALTDRALSDPRVELVLGDVARAIRRAASRGGGARFDAILLDLSAGPHRDRGDHPHYGRHALETTRRALARGGALAVWAEDPDSTFERRLAAAGFECELSRPGRGGRRHAVYRATPRGRADGR